MGRGSGKVTYLKIAACVLTAVGVLVYCSGAAVLPGRNAHPVSQRPMVVPDSWRDTEVTFEQAIPRFKVVNEDGIVRYWFTYGTADGLVHVCHLPKQMAEGKYTRDAWKATFAAYDVEVRSRGSKENIHECIIDFLWDYPFVSPPPAKKCVQVIVVNGKETRIVTDRLVLEAAAQAKYVATHPAPPSPVTVAQAGPGPMVSAPSSVAMPSLASPPSSFAMPSFSSGGGSSDSQRQMDQMKQDSQRQMDQMKQDSQRQMEETKKQQAEQQKQIDEQKRLNEPCSWCRGTGFENDSSTNPPGKKICTWCKGSGKAHSQ